MAKMRLDAIIKENANFEFQNRQDYNGRNSVCVFVGAMNGIGAKVLERLLMASYHSAVFYVLWNSSKSSTVYRKRVFDALLNRGCKLIYVEADDTRIADIDIATNQILAAEDKVDYLCMSKNIEEATVSSEGVQTETVVSYASRMRLISNLLPLLGRSQQPRVLNILNHGVRPTNGDYEGQKTIMQHTSVMTNLAFNHLATENPHITFILSPLGFDKAGSSQDTNAAVTMGVILKTWHSIPEKCRNVSERVFGTKADKILERHIYYLTGYCRESGAFHIDKRGDIVPNARPSEEEDKNRPEDAWEFAEKEWQLALATKVANQSSL
ncbi:hypothetical protein FHL15_001192 [Xylaria flabelliformis]|uniref:Ketoreductase (KR) domain-containing protein n=1 Tax=Xylaria flabelliformis TaxID=2512241 RepID=A0A553ICQ5_9PEZI|nr:hypothetical protein FHL15_001192 [Xylaria flabelliformis]